MRHIKINTTAFTICLLLISSLTYAQGDDVGDYDYAAITRNYNPTLADAVKLKFQAEHPEYKREEVKLSYEVPSRLIPLAYGPITIRPVSLGRERAVKHTGSHVKVGFGTQLSPLAEILWNDQVLDKKEQFEKLNYGVHFRHHSARATKLANQDFSETEGSVFGNFFLKKARISPKVRFSRDAVFYYGYDHEDTTFTNKEAKQFFNLLEFNTNIANSVKTKAGVNYSTDISFYRMKDKFDQTEVLINVGFGLEKVFNDVHHARIFINEDYTTFNGVNLSNRNRNILKTKLMYEYNDKVWKIFGGIEGAWEDGTFHLLPDIGMERAIFKNYIVLYNGWKMELRRLTYKSLIEQNPWLGQTFGFWNTKYEDRFMGLKGTVGGFTYDIAMGQKVVRRAPMFINDSTDMRKFVVIYNEARQNGSLVRKRLNILNVHIEMSYVVNSNLDFTITGDYNQYDAEAEARAWHMPQFFINFNTRYKIGSKVILTMDIYGVDGVYAKLPENKEERLKGAVDINLGAHYKFSKYLTFFLQVNNIAHFKYEKFKNYPSYGVNGMAGAMLTF